VPQKSALLAAIAFILSQDLPSEMSAKVDFSRETFAFFNSRRIVAKVAKVLEHLSRSATLGASFG
jgi:hypothetical protein